MRKIFSKVLAGATTVALVASLVAGINISNTSWRLAKPRSRS